MQILVLTHRLPYPPIDGGKIVLFNFLKQFSSKGCNVLLQSIIPEEESNCETSELASLVNSFKFISKDVKNKKYRLALNTLFSNLPYNMAKYIYPDMLESILQALTQSSIDLVHVEHLHMAHYGVQIKKHFPHIPVVLRQHNAEHTILTRYADSLRNPLLKHVMEIQAQRLKEYEKRTIGIFDRILAITEEDRHRFIDLDPSVEERVHVAPAGVDISTISTVQREPSATDIVSIAAMDWIPNQQGIVWFLEEVLPLVLKESPKTKFYIIGKNTPEWLQRYRSETVQVLGFVDDPLPYLRKSRVAVVPLHVGGGMRVKILNYFAWGIPVVSTPVGAEGIFVKDGTDILIGGDPLSFARCVLTVLRDDEVSARLVAGGRELVESKYSWEKIVGNVLSGYENLVRRWR
ncbi:glycosyltransferase [Geotalea uraniireducens]|uniref:Glycosyl transferase, group 1 n=1 Tax=Geotalea uraniireducens (strain Rf4) TaxID=351605 RepID=A5G6C6_GEOUR|nr:glycosyltransferase [Geotalea uraniireducens]ABQ27344.1 glycosyl transferase, group 1 [Geotalea uraniireducens Rf4]